MSAEQRCGFCDVSADYQAAKQLALLTGDIPAAAEADALAALGEDAAVTAHGFDNVDPQFGADHG